MLYFLIQRIPKQITQQNIKYDVFLEQQISILAYHVTLETRVMAAENSILKK